jgi:hypothetical protein
MHRYGINIEYFYTLVPIIQTSKSRYFCIGMIGYFNRKIDKPLAGGELSR